MLDIGTIAKVTGTSADNVKNFVTYKCLQTFFGFLPELRPRDYLPVALRGSYDQACTRVEAKLDSSTSDQELQVSPRGAAVE